MTRRDCESVAKGIRRGGHSREERHRIAEAVADEIQKERGSGGFDRKRFVSAATGYPEGG